MKKKSLIALLFFLTFFIIFALLVYFAIKYEGKYSNLFCIISCIISSISTIVLGFITIWQTFQYRQLEEKRHFIPNLIIFKTDCNNSSIKNCYQLNLTNNYDMLKVCLISPNTSIYRPTLTKVKILKENKIINTKFNSNLAYFNDKYDMILLKDVESFAALTIDKDMYLNPKYSFIITFEYYNQMGEVFSKEFNLFLKNNTYYFETSTKVHKLNKNQITLN